MRFYNRQHTYYCGIALHVTTMYVCILDGTSEVLVHRNMPSTPSACLAVVAPYRAGVVVAVECMFTWYWLADVCAADRFPQDRRLATESRIADANVWERRADSAYCPVPSQSIDSSGPDMTPDSRAGGE